MKKSINGILIGTFAGIIDVVPMILQKLTWDANISAFVYWLVVGFLITKIEMRVHPIVKGIVIAYLVLLPVVVLIAWKDPMSLIPISIMSTLLGALVGYSENRINSKIN